MWNAVRDHAGLVSGCRLCHLMYVTTIEGKRPRRSTWEGLGTQLSGQGSNMQEALVLIPVVHKAINLY